MLQSAMYRFETPLYIEYLKRFVPYYNKEEYEKLQRILRSETCEFSYNAISLDEIPKRFKGKKYDLIAIDNILQTYKSIQLLKNPYNVNRFVQKDLKPMLNPDGNIQVGYAFQYSTNMVLENLGKTPVNNIMPHPTRIREYESRKKEEINSILLMKYPDFYDYTLIPGVEDPLDEKQNLVLSLKR